MEKQQLQVLSKHSLVSLFAALLLLPLLASCCSLGAAKVPISDLNDRTVALVESTEDGLDAYCSGVWVAQDVILTASHCVADLGQDPLELLLKKLMGDESPPPNPVGQSGFYTIESQHFRSIKYDMKVLAFDEQDDLALLQADGAPSHPVVQISDQDYDSGDPAQVVGMPGGLWWRYQPGYVQAYRYRHDLANGGFSDVIQIGGSAVYPGDSGGPVFDSQGQLMGIAVSYLRGAGIGFCISNRIVSSFLKSFKIGK